MKIRLDLLDFNANYMEKYRISVILPVYNVSAYLRRCLDSIINNTYQNLQIICVDDGSTDDSQKIIKQYMDKDKRITVMEQDNQGVSAARNLGLRLADGDFVAFIDSDDWVHKDYFKILMLYQTKYNADVVAARHIKVNRFQEDQVFNDYDFEIKRFGNVKDIIQDYDMKSLVWGRLYRRECLSQYFFPDNLKLGEDTIYNLTVCCETENIKLLMVEAEIYYYYMNPESAVHTLKNDEWLGFCRWLLKDLDIVNPITRYAFLSEAIKKFLSIRYYYLCIAHCCDEITEEMRECIRKICRDKEFSFQEKLFFCMFTFSPTLYRLFRIAGDRTLLAWERMLKEKQK